MNHRKFENGSELELLENSDGSAWLHYYSLTNSSEGSKLELELQMYFGSVNDARAALEEFEPIEFI